MRVVRIILLLVGFIGIVENQAAPRVTSACEKSKFQWIFVLSPEANEINRLTELVESARSAIVERPKNDNGEVRVTIAPEDYEIFKKKTESLRVYRSHSWECVDSNSRLSPEVIATSTLPTTRKSKKAPPDVAARSSSNGTTKLVDPLSKYPNVSVSKSRENITKRLASSRVDKFPKSATKSGKHNDKTSSAASMGSTMRRGISTTSGTTRPPVATSKRKNGRKTLSKSTGKKIGNVNRGKTRGRGGKKKNSAKETGSHATTTKKSWTNLSTGSSSRKIPPKNQTGPDSRRGSGNKGKISLKMSDAKNLTKHSPPKGAKSSKMRKNKKLSTTTISPISRTLKSFGKLVTTTTQRPGGLSKSRATKRSIDLSTRRAVPETYSVIDGKEKRVCGKASGVKCGSRRSRRIKRANTHYQSKNFGPFKSSGCHIIRITNHCGNKGISVSLPESWVNQPPNSETSKVPELPPIVGSNEPKDESSPVRDNNPSFGETPKILLGNPDDEIYDSDQLDESLYSEIPGSAEESLDYYPPESSEVVNLKNLQGKGVYDEYLIENGEEEYSDSLEVPRKSKLVGPYERKTASLWSGQSDEFSVEGLQHGEFFPMKPGEEKTIANFPPPMTQKFDETNLSALTPPIPEVPRVQLVDGLIKQNVGQDQPTGAILNLKVPYPFDRLPKPEVPEVEPSGGSPNPEVSRFVSINQYYNVNYGAENEDEYNEAEMNVLPLTTPATSVEESSMKTPSGSSATLLLKSRLTSDHDTAYENDDYENDGDYEDDDDDDENYQDEAEDNPDETDE